MGKRRNKKQSNKQDIGNKTIEGISLAEGNAIEEKQSFEGMEQEAEEQNAVLYATEENGQMDGGYIDETYIKPFEDADDQGTEAYMDNVEIKKDQMLSEVPIDSLLENADMPAAEKEKEAYVDKEHLDLTNDFGEFTRDFFSRVVKWFKRNRRMAVISLAVCAGVVIVIWIVSSISRSIDAARLTASVSDNVQIDLGNNNGAIPVPQEVLQENAYPAVNELVIRYFEARQNNDIETLRTLVNYLDDVEIATVNAKYNHVEGYENITCYTKTGPIINSYIVYVYYDVKVRDWDVVAPSLTTLLVCTGDDGNLYIYLGDSDENIANYIAAVSSQEDVYDLWQRVETEYKEIMDANPDFSEYMISLNQIIRNEVGEQLAESGYLEDDTDEPVEEEPEEGTDVSENAAGEEQQTEDFEVQANTTVNVRASDSELADRLGKVETGTVLTCQEHQVNGWSRVIYEDQVGYIKTEYLQTVGEGVDETEATGTVTVSETVNVRKTANIEGEQIGVAYAGESFPLIGSTDGEWTQIIYNGQTGYIKSEFILE